MLPAIRNVISPTSSAGSNKDDDASSYADTYFQEIGFKVGDNSLLGSTESPDLDGEDLLTETERSMGLLGDNSLATDVELAAAVSETPPLPPTIPAYRRHAREDPHSKGAPSKLSAYSLPFHSYFGQLLSEDGKSISDSLKYSPASSYAVSVRKQSEDDVSTLGEESIKRRQPSQRRKPDTSVKPADVEIKHVRTRSTVEAGSSEDGDEVQDADKKLTRTAPMVSKASSSSIDKAGKGNRSFINFIIFVALSLLVGAAAVIAVSLVQMQNEETVGSTAGTWNPQPGSRRSQQPTQSPTESPTHAPVSPGQVARDDLLRIISAVSPSSITALGNTGSPQHRAFEWVSDDPDYLLFPVDRVVQRWVMATFYFSTFAEAWKYDELFNDTETGVGDPPLPDNVTAWEVELLDQISNTTSLGWLSDAHECTWYSSNETEACNEFDQLVSIYLPETGLVGTIPPELSLLSNSLAQIYLSNNTIRGSIPSEIGDLSNLELLQLDSNEITGTIPSELSLLPDLVVLDLGDNSITGTIPSQLGQLDMLVLLGLEENKLGGDIPFEISKLTNLEYLALESNSFNGTIPPELGEIPSLLSFTVHRNELVGEIPVQMCPSNDTNATWMTISADCSEIECECCTWCCWDCGSDETSGGNNTSPDCDPAVINESFCYEEAEHVWATVSTCGVIDDGWVALFEDSLVEDFHRGQAAPNRQLAIWSEPICEDSDCSALAASNILSFPQDDQLQIPQGFYRWYVVRQGVSEAVGELFSVGAKC